MEALGLAGWFDAVVTSARVGFEKPHPRLFEAARAVTPRGPIWMIGDNPVADFAGACGVGINAILVRTPHEVSPLADDLWGVAAILDSQTTSSDCPTCECDCQLWQGYSRLVALCWVEPRRSPPLRQETAHGPPKFRGRIHLHQVPGSGNDGLRCSGD